MPLKQSASACFPNLKPEVAGWHQQPFKMSFSHFNLCLAEHHIHGNTVVIGQLQSTQLWRPQVANLKESYVLLAECKYNWSIFIWSRKLLCLIQDLESLTISQPGLVQSLFGHTIIPIQDKWNCWQEPRKWITSYYFAQSQCIALAHFLELNREYEFLIFSN